MEVIMSKIKILAVLSSVAGNIAWAASNMVKVVATTSKTAADVITNNKRYDIEIYRKNEQFEVLTNVSYKKMLEVLKSIEVFPDLSVIVSKSKSRVSII
tara:strand:+ start:2603 stop:2899 length:297 start_codon:yes stop_codon:yes gene_type:complete